MRPKSLVWFDWLFLSARLLGVGPSVYSALVRPAALKAPDDPNTIVYLMVLLALPTILAILGLAASHKASRIAKWLVTLYIVYEILAVTVNLNYYFQVETKYIWMLAIFLSLDSAAAVMLHRSESRAWFRLKHQFGKIDPSTFD